MAVRTISFGVNYTPSVNWYYLWEDGKTLDGVQDDLQSIADIGCDHIRLQLRWDVFQQERNRFSASAFEKLLKVLDLARDCRLMVELAVFTGWLSGFWFLPEFLDGTHIITDAVALEAEKNFLSELAKRAGGHPALLGIDLGNEINMFGCRSAETRFTMDEGDAWYAELSSFCGERFPGKQVVVGVDHQPYYGNVSFSRGCLGRCGTATSLHAWTKFTGALERGGILGQRSRSLARINAEMAVAYLNDLARPVQIQEFGVSSLWANKSEISEYLEATVSEACLCDSVCRFTYWCSHDIDRKFQGFDALEYDLGLFDCKNVLKEQGAAFAAAARRFRLKADTENKPKTAVVLRDGGMESKTNFGWYYGEAFLTLLNRGENPAFILPEALGNDQYLEKRNIVRIVEAEELRG